MGGQLHCFGSGGLAILFSPLRAGYSSAAAVCSFQGPRLMTPGPLWVRVPNTAQSRLMPSQHAAILPLHTSRPQLYLHCEAFGRYCLPRPRFAFGTWLGNSVIQAYVEDLPAIVPKACQLTSRYIFALVRCLGVCSPHADCWRVLLVTCVEAGIVSSCSQVSLRVVCVVGQRFSGRAHVL